MTIGLGSIRFIKAEIPCVAADDRRRENLRDVFARLLRQLLHPVQVPEVALLLAEAAPFDQRPVRARRVDDEPAAVLEEELGVG